MDSLMSIVHLSAWPLMGQTFAPVPVVSDREEVKRRSGGDINRNVHQEFF